MRKYIKNIRIFIVGQILFDLVSTICIGYKPVIQKKIFDDYSTLSLRDILYLLGLYFCLILLNVLLQYICMLLSWKGAVHFERDMKKDLFHAVFNMKKDKFFEKQTGEYVSLQANDITAIESDYLQPFIDLIRSANMFVVYGVILWIYVDKRIAITMMIMSVITGLLPKALSKSMDSKRAKYQDQLSTYTAKITDLLDGIMVINKKTFNSIDNKHGEELDKVAEKRYSYGKAKTTAIDLDLFAMLLMEFVAIGMAAIFLVKGRITLGAAVATLSYISSFTDPLNSILYDVTSIQSVKNIRDKFINYVGNIEKDEANEKERKSVNDFDRLSFENVSYEIGNFSLKNVKADFVKGKKYALIGDNGGGKSTIMKLIMEYISPSAGSIKIDGCSIDSLDTSGLIAYVDQKEHIYAENMENNVSVFGAYGNCDDAIKKTSDSAKVYNLMRNLFLAKKTDIDCSKFSGGQKQTIAFMRMLARDFKIVLLDESFSAMDPESKEAYSNFIFNSNEMKDKTVIMITHDTGKENLSRFDEVYKLSNGEIERLAV